MSIPHRRHHKRKADAEGKPQAKKKKTGGKTKTGGPTLVQWKLDVLVSFTNSVHVLHQSVRSEFMSQTSDVVRWPSYAVLYFL